MQDFINFDKEFKKFQKDMESKRRQSIKGLYKNKIKITFLYKVYENIRNRTNNFQLLNLYYPNNEINTAVNFFAGGDPIDLDVCNQITYIHEYNMILLSPEEKSKYQTNNDYIEKLVNQVLNQIYIRRYGSMNFKHYELYNLQRLEYYPPIYYLNALILMIGENTETYFVDLFDRSKEEWLIAFMAAIVKKSNGIINVISGNNLDCGYSILRGIIELYITFLCIKYSTINSKIYAKFVDYKVSYDKTQVFDKEFEDMFNKKSKGVSIVDYLNYGWLDSIFEFEYLDIKRQYKFIDLLNLAEFITKKDKVIHSKVLYLRKFYYKCHIYTHGTPITNNYLVQLADLYNPLTEVILGVVHEIQAKYNIPNINKINVIKSLCDASCEFRKKSKDFYMLDSWN